MQSMSWQKSGLGNHAGFATFTSLEITLGIIFTSLAPTGPNSIGTLGILPALASNFANKLFAIFLFSFHLHFSYFFSLALFAIAKSFSSDISLPKLSEFELFTLLTPSELVLWNSL